MNINPVGPRVVVKVVVEEKKKKSELIILPEKPDAREATRKGVIVSVGFGFKLLEPTIGTTILFNNFGHVEVKEDEESYLIIEEGDILGVCQ